MSLRTGRYAIYYESHLVGTVPDEESDAEMVYSKTNDSEARWDLLRLESGRYKIFSKGGVVSSRISDDSIYLFYTSADHFPMDWILRPVPVAGPDIYRIEAPQIIPRVAWTVTHQVQPRQLVLRHATDEPIDAFTQYFRFQRVKSPSPKPSYPVE
ncbi:hypothetical protein AMATHDRAFT_69232 [Amanita thiersii Skay4041]|uniref:Ricin B lectin domain-containing protein n=1 Tax=Amanita thiersii Skay4041 TaxID=703135 RepID=A0A2A9N8L7_9AGAR|nr:hypothetical protein AMATHDRAFT_69232 [Amanita thiersii Skay4041]